MPSRLRACAWVSLFMAAACGEGIALDPGASQPPSRTIRDDAGADARRADRADIDDAAGSGENPDDAGSDATDESDETVVDAGVDADISFDGVNGDREWDVASDASIDVEDEARDARIDAPLDRSSDGDDARLDDVGVSDDRSDGSLDATNDRADASDAADRPSDGRDGTADGASPDTFDGCTVDCWPAADYYVDASAPLGGNGSKLLPFKTITAAIEAHLASPGTPHKAYVAAGTYDEALGERFPLMLRGLSLEGAGRDRTIIVGQGSFDHAAEIGAFPDQYWVTVVAGERTLPTRLSELSVRSVSPVPATNYHGVFCDRGNGGDAVSSPSGETSLDRVRIGPGYYAGAVATSSSSPSPTGCAMVVTRSILTGVWFGVVGQGCDYGGTIIPVTLRVGSDDPQSGNTFTGLYTPYDAFDPASGVYLLDCVSRASIQYNQFVDSSAGVTATTDIDPTPMSRMAVVVQHNTFDRLSVAGYNGWRDDFHFVDELSDNRFTNVAARVGPFRRPATAVVVSLFAADKIRRNVFIGNDIGLEASFMDASGSPFDLGTTSDPGGNVFRCNSSTLEYGADLVLRSYSDPPDTWGGTLHAAGNAWDHVPPTVSTVDPPPAGSDVAIFRANVTIDSANATVATDPCPDGRVPGP